MNRMGRPMKYHSQAERTEAKREWYHDAKPVKKWARRWAAKRQPVSDVRYLVHIRPAGEYVREFFARVIK